MGCYRKFIRGYATIIDPMEKLLKKHATFVWSQECQGSLDTLKAKMASAPILVFPYWIKDFYVHVDASSSVLGMVLEQPEEGDIDNLISFTSQMLSSVEKSYTAIEREALAMLYAL